MQINQVKFSKLLTEEKVFNVFAENYTQSIILWYEFQRVWYHRAITTFNDVNKFFILEYFFKKTFSSYSEHFINKSFEEFYKCTINIATLLQSAAILLVHLRNATVITAAKIDAKSRIVFGVNVHLNWTLTSNSNGR